jgi:hypothetical protein
LQGVIPLEEVLHWAVRDAEADREKSTMRKGGRARQITTGRALKEEDDLTRIVRDPSQGPLDVHHDAPVDYEKMWKNLRVDADIFWSNFLPQVQAGLCKGCQEHFTKVFTVANKKAGFGVREGGPAGRVPPDASP